MEKLSILMSRETFESWGKTHPLGTRIAVVIDGTAMEGTVAEFADYHGRIEVRLRLGKGR